MPKLDILLDFLILLSAWARAKTDLGNRDAETVLFHCFVPRAQFRNASQKSYRVAYASHMFCTRTFINFMLTITQ